MRAPPIPSKWIIFAAAVLAAVWSAAVFPAPERLIEDSDHGYQLAGAQQVLAGEHPFVDFHDVYGPLVYYASALGQRASGGRVIGELAVVLLGWVTAYTLLLRLFLRGGVPWWASVGATATTLLVQPESYKYYMVLGPVVVITALWSWVERPGRWRMLALGAAIAGAGLFRPDVGVFSFAASAIAVGVALPGWRERATAWLALTGAVLLAAAPWLAWVAWHGGLEAYLLNSSVDAWKVAVGLSLPWREFDFSAGGSLRANAAAYLHRLPGLWCVLGVVGLACHWRRLDGVERARWAGVAAYAILSLLQASHRVSWAHTRDVLPLILLLMVWGATRDGLPVSPGWGRVLRVGIACVLLSALPGVLRHEWRALVPSAVVEKIGVYAGAPDATLRHVSERSPRSRAARQVASIQRLTAPTDRVFTLYGSPQLNYFSGRRFAGGLMAVYPGYFADESAQAVLIARLRAERVALVLVPVDPRLDARDERKLPNFAPAIWAFLATEFAEVERIDGYRVLVPRSTARQASATQVGERRAR
jgi:hypothetical protein